MSVREEFWASPWFISHAEDLVSGAYENNNNNNTKITTTIIIIMIIIITK